MYADIPPVVAGGEGRRCLPISPLPSTRGAWGGAAGEGMVAGGEGRRCLPIPPLPSTRGAWGGAAGEGIVAGGEGRRCLPIPPLLLDARTAEEEAGPTQPLLKAGEE